MSTGTWSDLPASHHGEDRPGGKGKVGENRLRQLEILGELFSFIFWGHGGAWFRLQLKAPQENFTLNRLKTQILLQSLSFSTLFSFPGICCKAFRDLKYNIVPICTVGINIGIEVEGIDATFVDFQTWISGLSALCFEASLVVCVCVCVHNARSQTSHLLDIGPSTVSGERSGV